MKRMLRLITTLVLFAATLGLSQGQIVAYQAEEIYNDTITNALDSTYAALRVGEVGVGLVFIQFEWNENISGTNGGNIYLESAPTPSGPWVREMSFTTDTANILYFPSQGRNYWRIDAALTGTHTSYLGVWVGYYPYQESQMTNARYNQQAYRVDTIADTALDSISTLTFYAMPCWSARTVVIANTSPYAGNTEDMTATWYVRTHANAPWRLDVQHDISAADVTDVFPAVGSETAMGSPYPLQYLEVEQNDTDTLAVQIFARLRPLPAQVNNSFNY